MLSYAMALSGIPVVDRMTLTSMIDAAGAVQRQQEHGPKVHRQDWLRAAITTRARHRDRINRKPADGGSPMSDALKLGPVNDGGRVWTPEAVRGLGMTTDVETAASILGIGRTLAYELARTDTFPVRVLHIGRRMLVPIPELLRYLGAE